MRSGVAAAVMMAASVAVLYGRDSPIVHSTSDKSVNAAAAVANEPASPSLSPLAKAAAGKLVFEFALIVVVKRDIDVENKIK